MSQFNDTGYSPVTLTEAVAQYLRTDAAGTLCGITERGIGVNCTSPGASGDVVNVALWSKAGTMKVKSSGTIAAGAIVYTAAAGEVGPSASTAFPLGIAMEAAVDGDVFEMLPLVGETAVS